MTCAVLLQLGAPAGVQVKENVMKKLLLLCGSAVLVSGLFFLRGQAQRPERPEAVHQLMVGKLKSAQALLEGLAMNDFTKITRSAEKLIDLSRSEEWFLLKTPRYELHSNEFRRAAEKIVRKSREKNLDGAALAYFDMTMSCLRCHEYVREVRDARRNLPPANELGVRNTE
jgi:hypothetical protein